MLARQIGGKIGHAGAAEHDGFRAVLGLCALDFARDAAAGIRMRILQRQHRHIGGPDAGAAAREAIADKIMLDDRDRPVKRRDDRELARNQACSMESRFANADDGSCSDAAGGIKPGIIEAGDDMAGYTSASASRMRRIMPGMAKTSS